MEGGLEVSLIPCLAWLMDGKAGFNIQKKDNGPPLFDEEWCVPVLKFRKPTGKSKENTKGIQEEGGEKEEEKEEEEAMRTR